MKKRTYILILTALISLLFIFTLTTLMSNPNLSGLNINFKVVNFELKTEATYTETNKKAVNID